MFPCLPDPAHSARVTATEVRAALAEAGVVPSSKLGQNFLSDQNTARWIVEQLEPGPEDFVVEVGPGTGALSGGLVGRVRKLLLVEFDRRRVAEAPFEGEAEWRWCTPTGRSSMCGPCSRSGR